MPPPMRVVDAAGAAGRDRDAVGLLREPRAAPAASGDGGGRGERAQRTSADCIEASRCDIATTRLRRPDRRAEVVRGRSDARSLLAGSPRRRRPSRGAGQVRPRRLALEHADAQSGTRRACDRGSSCAACGRSCGTRCSSHGISSSRNRRTSRLSGPGPKSRSSEPRAEHHVDLADVRQADHRVEIADVDARARLLERLAHRAGGDASRRSRESRRAASTGRAAARSRAGTAAPGPPIRGRQPTTIFGILVVDRAARGADEARQRCRLRECATRGGRSRSALQNFIAPCAARSRTRA